MCEGLENDPFICLWLAQFFNTFSCQTSAKLAVSCLLVPKLLCIRKVPYNLLATLVVYLLIPMATETLSTDLWRKVEWIYSFVIILAIVMGSWGNCDCWGPSDSSHVTVATCDGPLNCRLLWFLTWLQMIKKKGLGRFKSNKF